MSNEIFESEKNPNLHCFPKLFDYSADELCLACETAEPPTPKDFKRVFGCQIEDTIEKFHMYAEENWDGC